jgi:ABC-type multidrug transport system fused ATPase/permease subunit
VLKQKLHKIGAACSNGWELAHWLFHESYLRHKGDVLIVALLSGGALFLQISVFFIAMMFVKSFDGHHAVHFAGWKFTELVGNRGLFIVTSYIVFALSTSALLHYYTQVRSLLLAQLFERRCLQWVADSLALYPFFGISQLAWLNNDRAVARCLEQDTQACSRTLRSLFQLLFPSAIVVLSAGFLIYLNPFITLFVGVFAILGMVGNFIIYHGGFKNSLMREQNNQRQRELRNKVLDAFAAGRCDEYSASLEGYFFTHRNDRWHQGKDLQTTEKSRLFTRILSGFLLACVVVFLANTYNGAAVKLVNLVLYVVVLRYCTSHFLNGVTILSRLNSALPGVRRVMQIRTIAARAEQSPTDAGESATLEYTSLIGSKERYDLAKPQPVIILAAEPFDRFLTGGLISSVKGGGPGYSSVWNQQTHNIAGATALFLKNPGDYETLPKIYRDRRWTHGMYIWLDSTERTNLHDTKFDDYFSITISDKHVIGGACRDLRLFLREKPPGALPANLHHMDDFHDTAERLSGEIEALI